MFLAHGLSRMVGDLPQDTKPAGGGRGNATGGQERGGGHRANTVQLMTKSNTAASSDKRGVPDLYSERWASLLELLNPHKANSIGKMTGKDSNTSWIIDTGASNHMTGSLEVLNDLRKSQLAQWVC